MKDSMYENMQSSLRNFDTPQEAIKYYEYLLKHNSESSVYPGELREFHKGVVLGLKGGIELREVVR